MLIHRRQFLQTGLLAGIGFLTGCSGVASSSRPALRTYRIGLLTPASAASAESADGSLNVLRRGLGELGYVEGTNISIELRAAAGRSELLGEFAAELVRLPVDALVTSGTEATRAAMRTTQTIPIVFGTAGDPVGEGLVASLAHPGGNVTGLTLRAGAEEYAKRLQLLREAVPSLTRLAILGYRRTALEIQDTEALARAQGLEVLTLELSSPDVFDSVLGAGVDGHADGLFVSTDAVLVPLVPRIVAFAEQHRLPAIYATDDYARAGGLLTFGVRVADNYRRAATFIDKILKGAKPADLPVERPTQFIFVVNLKAAQAIGLTIPDSVLEQATQIIR